MSLNAGLNADENLDNMERPVSGDLSETRKATNSTSIGRTEMGKKLRRTIYRNETKRIVSIPTRFKTILTGHTQDRAFGSSSQRFNDKSEVLEAPGPGSYSLYTESCWKENFESQSRKGTGGMASKSARKTDSIRYANTGPGPASYSYISDHSFDSIQKESSRIVEPNLLERIRAKMKEKAEMNPYRQRTLVREDKTKLGPGTYEVSMPKKVPNYSEVVFKSKGSREETKYEDKEKLLTPAVGSYFLDRSLIRNEPYKNKPTAAFCKTVVRDNIMANDLEKVKKQIILEMPDKAKIEICGQIKDRIPGPGDYELNESFKQVKFGRPENMKGGMMVQGTGRVMLRNLNKDNPGPGQYKTKSGFEGEKYRVYHAVFMSETMRKGSDAKKEGEETEATYDETMKMKKESFHYNKNSIWMK